MMKSTIYLLMHFVFHFIARLEFLTDVYLALCNYLGLNSHLWGDSTDYLVSFYLTFYVFPFFPF